MAVVEGVMANNHTRHRKVVEGVMGSTEGTTNSIAHGVVGDTPVETRPNYSAMNVKPWDTYPTIAQTSPGAVVMKQVIRPLLAAPRLICVQLFSACLKELILMY